eukprot:10072203-Heterocapsa_arctica.AAC.1
MVRVLRYFRWRRISPATRQRRVAVWVDVKCSSSARQAVAMFPGRLLAGNYTQTRASRQNSWLLAWDCKKGEGKVEEEGKQYNTYEKDNDNQ